MAKFAEFRIGEVVRRIYLPRTRVKTLLGMHRACWRANILVIGVFSDVKEDRVMEDLSSRTAQEVLDDHLNLAENWGGERGFERGLEEDEYEDDEEEYEDEEDEEEEDDGRRRRPLARPGQGRRLLHGDQRGGRDRRPAP